eukprot:TRINITY_DN21169_c0_g2_i1.p1 TRINITY_DN21169_c0_g2~~TRINITY_DN21169_c0_g2_i1.p1  ORF type:complete len:416 (+),score=82.63 TRINITY_DN21169_c0_g2_i1:72-1250(+)
MRKPGLVLILTLFLLTSVKCWVELVLEQRVLWLENETGGLEEWPLPPLPCGITATAVNFVRRVPRDYSKEPPTLEDRISILNFKELAEVCYSHGPHPYGFNTTFLTEELLPCLQNGTVIHIDGKGVKKFAEEMASKIPVSYILIVIDYDDPPGFDSMWSLFEEDPKCLGWFVADSDLPLNVHPSKYYPIPIGLSQWPNIPQASVLAQLSSDLNVTYTAAGQPFKKTVSHFDVNVSFVPLSVGVDFRNDRESRAQAWNVFCENLDPELVGHVKCFGSGGLTQGHLYEHYLSMLEVDFAVSPPGGGIDCYRNWEMLFLGVYPIVLNNTLNPVFEDLPVLIVQNWSDVTLQLLSEFKHEAGSKYYEGYRKLYINYWEDTIWKLRPGFARGWRLHY